MKKYFLFLLAPLLICGCSPKIVEKVVNSTDTAYVEKQVHDSIYVQDSVYIYEWQNGDTVRILQDRWHVKWRERIVRDTAYVAQRDTVKTVQVREVERRLTLWQKIQMWAGRLAMLSVVCSAAFVLIASRRKK